MRFKGLNAGPSGRYARARQILPGETASLAVSRVQAGALRPKIGDR